MRARTAIAPFLLVVSWLLPGRAIAQTGVLEGVVRARAGAELPAAAVRLRRDTDTLALRVFATDPFGRFRIPGLRPGRYHVRASFIGYSESSTPVEVVAGRTTSVAIELDERPIIVAPLAVEAERVRTRFEADAGATVRELAGTDVKLLPGLAEADVLRAIEVLPGVVTTSDFSSAFNVRGGSADQNLILLDGIPVFNPFHLGGMFSVFNADMVARAELLAGGFPARHGGRVSSVLTVESDPGEGGFATNMGVSLLASRAAVSADLPPSMARGLGLRSGRARVSARRSYFDQLLKPAFEFPYHLTDIQVYGEAWTHGGSRATITGYTGEDVLDLRRLDIEDFPVRLRMDWGNNVAGGRRTAPLGSGTLLDLRTGYSRFRTSLAFPDFNDTRFRSLIEQGLLDVELDVPLGGSTAGALGAELNRMRYDNLAEAGGTVFRQGRSTAWLAAASAQITWRPGERWLLEIGGRADSWVPSDAERLTILSPRLAIKHFFAGNGAAVKLAAGRYTQFLHSLRDEELPIGIDVWVLAGGRAPHVVSDQVQAGLEFLFGAGWYAGLEAYGRWFDGVATNNFADDPNDPADDLVSGTGLSYGADFLLRRDEGRLTGWLTLSWLKATRSFPDFLSGVDDPPDRSYPPVFDRRVDADLVLRYRLPRGIETGLRWNFGTGLPYTRAIGSYNYFELGLDDGRLSMDDRGNDDEDDPLTAVLLGPRNGSRYPAYHRLDVSFRKKIDRRWGSITPHLDVLNVYNRRNVLFYFYQYDRSPPRRAGFSMFPLLPTLGVEVAF